LYEAWTWLANLLERRAEENLSVGTKRSASENYFPASLYHKIAEQFIPTADPLRVQSYGRARRLARLVGVHRPERSRGRIANPRSISSSEKNHGFRFEGILRVL